ncbi:MAG: AmmeMemoRadiSam system protein B [Gammaproteobacteria bacterium]
MTGVIRKPAVAGLFYPQDRQALEQTVTQLLSSVPTINVQQPVKALIVPHAGYIYSGRIAASAYAQLLPEKKQIHRVVLLGPSHRVGFRGLAVSQADYFRTPLGDIPIDRESYNVLEDLSFVNEREDAHHEEHSLEVQLPFLQVVLDDFLLVPIVVGDAEPADISRVIELLWGGPETVIIISSDLSHYLDYQHAQNMDAKTAKAIVSMNPEAIGYDQACGRLPVNGLLLAAKHHHLQSQLLDLRNSGDTAGTQDRVVGYGAFSLA